ncbi:unnamed protein product [Somion occarium]|uniref:Uncharacterized protein n=1 Tax=Somion occarium TaxID=3059160 RepID=A0ABP1DAF3_9APHY
MLRLPSVPILWRNWSQKISKRNKYFAILVFAVVVAAVALAEGLMADAAAQETADKVVQSIVQGQSGAVLLGNIYNIDIPSRSVSISWLVVGCGEFQSSNASTSGFIYAPNCSRLNGTVDFYVDGSSDPTVTSDSALYPFDQRTGQSLFVQSVHAFESTGRLVLYAWKGLDQEFAYPFDGYQMETTFIARDSDTGQTLPILGARIVSSTNNMNFFLRYDRATVQYNTTSGETSSSRTMELALGRNGFTKAFVVTLFIVNWALTAVCAYITISATVGDNLSESIVVLPLSVILTIPALRALWIDAPAFGLLLGMPVLLIICHGCSRTCLPDACGTFLQMVIVSFCSLFLIIVIGMQKQKEADKAMLQAEEGRKNQQKQADQVTRTPSEKGDLAVRDLPTLQRAV